MFRVAIVTLSDKGAAGQRTDESGAVIREIAEQNGYEVVSYTLLPDEREQISAELRRLCDENVAELVLTTGGTMRYSSLNITKRAMLSRAVAVIRGGTLIVNLPGSPKAVRENLEYVIPALGHGLEILTGRAGECARK